MVMVAQRCTITTATVAAQTTADAHHSMLMIQGLRPKTHLEALLHFVGKTHTRPGIGGQIDQRQLLLKCVLGGRAENRILPSPKGAAVEGDVIGHRHHLQHSI